MLAKLIEENVPVDLGALAFWVAHWRRDLNSAALRTLSN